MRKLLLTLAFVPGVAFAQEDGPGPNLVIEVQGQANGTIVIEGDIPGGSP